MAEIKNTNIMKNVKNWTVEKKDEIERILINMWANLGIDIPSNFDDIVQNCYEDVCETADLEKWHSGDVAIAFRRWIEEQNKSISDVSNVENLKEQAQELIDLGDSREKAKGQGMMTVIDAIKPIPKKSGTHPNYFEVVAQGWNEGLQREEIQIHCGENGNLMIVKTDEGFVVDAYDVNGENINTMTVWENDINPPDEDV